MRVQCKQCKRLFDIEDKSMSGIRPSSYLCPSCIDKDSKIGAGSAAGLMVVLIIIRKIIRFILKR